MNSMTTTKGQEAAASLMSQAKSTDPDWALTNATPASLDVRDRYVYVELSGGGPSTELLIEFSDKEDAAYWFENEPVGAWFTYKDWGSREDVRLDGFDAAVVVQALERSPMDLNDDDNES